MVDKEFRKIGFCIVPSQNSHSSAIESTFFEPSKNGWFALTLGYEVDNSTCIYKQEIYADTLDKYYEISYTPHFVFFENIYEVLLKYSENNKLFLLGTANLISGRSIYEELKGFYFKTGKGTFLEVIYCDFYHLAWINEAEDIDELHLNNVMYSVINSKVSLCPVFKNDGKVNAIYINSDTENVMELRRSYVTFSKDFYKLQQFSREIWKTYIEEVEVSL